MKKDKLDFYLSEELFSTFQNNIFNESTDILNISKFAIHNIPNRGNQSSLPFHYHYFFELHASLVGYAIYHLPNGTSVKVEQGEWILFPKKYRHKLIESSPQFIKFSCYFDILTQNDKDSQKDIAYNALYEILSSISVQHGVLSKHSLNCIMQMHDNFNNTHPFAQIKQKLLATDIIIDILSPFCQKPSAKPKGDKSNDTRLAIATQYIKDNIRNNVTCEEVAKKVFLSSKQLDRIFSKELSMSVTDFITEQKYEEAKRLILSTSLPIYKISEQLGFCDPSYFNYFFKKCNGIPPSKFRNMYKTQAPTSFEKKSD